MRGTLLVAAIAVAGTACTPETGSEGGDPRLEGVVPVDGAKLRYVIEGKGIPTLVTGSSLYYPRTFSSNLRDHLRLVFVDARHFTASDVGFDVSSLTIDTFSDDLEAVRQALALDRVAVIGHSIHGLLALEYAARYPQHVSHVVAIGSPPIGLAAMTEASDGYWASAATAQRKKVLADNWQHAGGPEALGRMTFGEALIATYVINGPKYWHEPTYDASPLWEGMEPNEAVASRVFGNLFGEYDVRPTLAQIRANVLVIMGVHDYVVPHTLWSGVTREFPIVAYHSFEESGHTPQLEEPERFDSILIDWLRR